MRSTLEKYITLRPNQVEVFDWWDIRESLLETIQAYHEGAPWARRDLHRLLKCERPLVLTPGSPVPTSMPPGDELKFIATQALHEKSPADDVEFRRALNHLENTAESPTLRRFVRLTLQRRRKASNPPSR